MCKRYYQIYFIMVFMLCGGRGAWADIKQFSVEQQVISLYNEAEQSTYNYALLHARMELYKQVTAYLQESGLVPEADRAMAKVYTLGLTQVSVTGRTQVNVDGKKAVNVQILARFDLADLPRRISRLYWDQRLKLTLASLDNSIAIAKSQLDGYRQQLAVMAGDVEQAESVFQKTNQIYMVLNAAMIFADGVVEGSKLSPLMIRLKWLFEKAMSVDSLRIDASYIYGRILLDHNDFYGAMRMFKRVLKEDPDFLPGHAYLGYVYMRTSAHANAERELRSALARNSNDYLARSFLVADLVLMGRLDDAEQELELLHKIGVTSAETYWAQAMLQKARMRLEQAESLAQKALKHNPYHLDTVVFLADIYHRMKRKDAAEHYYKRLVSLQPFAAIHYYNLGYFYLDAGKFERSILASTQAFNLDSTMINAINNMGEAQERIGDMGAAVKTYKQGLERDPTNPLLNASLGMLYFEMGAADMARPYLENAKEYLNKNQRFESGIKGLVTKTLVAIDSDSAPTPASKKE